MTRQFNLLPARYAERMAERRAAGFVGAGLLVLVVILTLTSLTQSRQLTNAENRRDAERARTNELLAQRRTLVPFRQLADGILGRERLLAAAMKTQVSWASVMTSLSTTFPAGASLTSLTAESVLPPFGAVASVNPGTEGRVIGSMTLKGYSVERFTPGVERMLQLLEAVRGVSEPRLELGTADRIGERPVTTFEGVTFVDGEAMSGRYGDGLPPEHNVELPPLGAGATARGATGTPAPR